MCYDISFKSKVGDLSDYFPDTVFDDQLDFDFGPEAHISGHNYAPHPVYYKNSNYRTELKMMNWSLVPPHIKDLGQFAKRRSGFLNAKSEKIFEDKTSYWYKLRKQRCLIPVTAFYEHRDLANFKSKIPYHLTVKDQQKLFLPGLFAENYNVNSNGEPFTSFTMLTRKAEKNWLMREIHNGNAGEDKFRMLLLLPFELSELYLSPDLSDSDYKMILNYEMPAEELDYYTVASIRSRKPRPDGKAKDEFFDFGLPPITNDTSSTQAELFT